MFLCVKKEDGILQHNRQEAFTRFTLLNSSYAILYQFFALQYIYKL